MINKTDRVLVRVLRILNGDRAWCEKNDSVFRGLLRGSTLYEPTYKTNLKTAEITCLTCKFRLYRLGGGHCEKLEFASRQ